MMKTLLAAATLAVFSAPALAQTPTAPPAPEKSMAEQAFAKHDANKDGALSLTEVQTIDAKITQADFDAYDGDKNKALTVAEFSKWVEAKTTAPASKPG
jgi:Ca2+-binding EF-hand superfamily protein